MAPLRPSLTTAAIKIARERKSSVLASNAVHHRIDSLTSIVALLTIGGAHVISDASWLDPVGGIIIAAMVIRAGWGNTKSALLELGDVTIDEEVKEKIQRVSNRALKGNSTTKVVGVENGSDVEVRDVQGIKSGQNYLIDIELVAPSTFTLQQLGAIEEAVRNRVGLKVRGARRVRVKFVSSEDASSNLTTDFIPADISPRSSPEPEAEDEHNHSHVHSNGHAHTRHEQKKDR
jgi:divalent metal cation (Fe/Co/Zn/Cd) transporter